MAKREWTKIDDSRETINGSSNYTTGTVNYLKLVQGTKMVVMNSWEKMQ